MFQAVKNGICSSENVNSLSENKENNLLFVGQKMCRFRSDAEELPL